ncbi:MAG: hypothetical protein KF718_07795 [Polyangiaceae bacterium]|nr:hypothetical protein [Polyangiaceae bacterium]
MLVRRSLLAVFASGWCASLLPVGCDKSSEPSASADAGGDAAGAGSGATGGWGAAPSGGAPPTGGIGGSGGATPDAGMWQPAGDPGWHTPAWACGGISVATNPVHGAPPLEWEPCGSGLPGCLRLLVPWQASIQRIQQARVGRTSPTTIVTLSFSRDTEHFDTEHFKAVYEDGAPKVVWRYQPGLAPEGCSMTTPEWTPNHLCVSTTEVFDGAVTVGRQFLLPPTSSGPPLASWTSTATFPSGCSTELLGADDSAGSGWVRDLVSGNEYPLEASPGIAWPPVIHEDIALFRRWWGDGTYIRLDAWLWKRPNATAPLVEAPDGEMVYDVQTDGATLVWVQTKSESVLDRAPGELWTSPFSKTSSALQPSKRRTTPAISVALSMKRVGSGYYALIEQPLPAGNENWKLHVYRLSDARHWQVALPGALRPVEVVHVDAEEVWVRAHTMKVADMTLIRRRIDQLGPGD